MTDEPADFSAAMMVSVIEVAMKPAARIHVTLPSAVAAERPETAAATTHAKATALRPLQQYHGDQAEGQNQVNDQNDIFHGYDSFRFWLAGIYSSLPMGARVDCRRAAIGPG